MSVSIIMTPWNRRQLLANTLDSIFKQSYSNLEIIVVEDRPSEFGTEALCNRYGVRYAARRGQVDGWHNPAPLLNYGIKQAKGDIIIFQNAECKYETATGIADLVEEVEKDEMVSTVAHVQSLDARGNFLQWYSHSTAQERAGWISCFCQAVRRTQIERIGGFDEIFNGYGFEDDLFEFRLRHNGIKFKYATNVLVSHQWHEKYNYTGIEQMNESIFKETVQAVQNGSQPNIANHGKEWGRI